MPGFPASRSGGWIEFSRRGSARAGRRHDPAGHDGYGRVGREQVRVRADVDDVEGLTAGVMRVYDDARLRAELRTRGRETAEANAEERLDPLWADLLDGFVRRAE